MRVLIQRVTEGRVVVTEEVVGEIGRGYVLLAGVGEGDDEQTIAKMAEKVVNLRLFNNDEGKFDQSLLDVGGEALVVSQFTLFGDARKGRRPSFIAAARPELAEPLCDLFAVKLKELGVPHVDTGRFGADMKVDIHNDGPVTLWLDSAEW
ncbi:D-aminoacyl-tRNA deacylase [Algisphaera agarilytica]|uniref:D-aminoacyl-tRNA deacylase n=1 Tax=Algisphaera agarilytica TaxID=1385975 RepID=A0A7X0LJY3_9BACT|nr:D-aminoacyl-tRNA deacylase [Algisphaera agarilytica]MBB6429076.1 D-tyrosyl-tRNA(Tyr) deacylase [Algisphaera agarilytica]